MAPKKEIPIRLPEALPITDWLIYGLDPSMSRTGFALQHVSEIFSPQEAASTWSEWLGAGSIKNESTKDPLWIRGKGMALHLRDLIDKASLELIRDFVQTNQGERRELGLIISMEYPTPTDDFLVALNRIIHLVFFEEQWPSTRFSDIRILTTNAATLRSLMGLHQKGNRNKGENIEKAYQFISKEKFPKLDSDACDGVLLAMMGRYAASLLMGHPEEVPDKFKTRLCSTKDILRGKGRNSRVTTEGLLWTTGQRPEYWYTYSRKDYVLEIRDAASTNKGLDRVIFTI